MGDGGPHGWRSGIAIPRRVPMALTDGIPEDSNPRASNRGADICGTSLGPPERWVRREPSLKRGVGTEVSGIWGQES